METLRTKIERLATAKERATLKGSEIAKVAKLGRVTRSKYEIDIISINAIDGGVEMFARVWQNGKQIGFGKDGSVDIERFRFFNPPVLVSDPTGDIVRRGGVDIKTGNRFPDKRFKEDPQESVIRCLERIIPVVGKDDSNIVRGKIGNTTSTFYSNAGGDGVVGRGQGGYGTTQSTWSDARNTADGQGTDGNQVESFFMSDLETAGNYTCSRVFLPFDTSAIDDTDTIDSATLLINQPDTAGEGTRGVGLIQTSQASNTALATGDFDALTLNSATEGATRVTFDSIGDKTFTLNSTGLGWISKTGYTKLGLRMDKDLDNSAPTARNYSRLSLSEEAGTTEDPTLTVVHTSSSVSVTVSGTVQTATFSIPAPTYKVDVSITPSAQVATFSIPAVEVLVPDTHVFPSAQTTTFSIPAPTVVIDVEISVVTQQATFSIPSATASIGYTATPAVQVLTFSLPASTVTGDALAEPSVQVATFSIPSYSPVVSVVIEASILLLTLTIPDPPIRGRIWGDKFSASADTWNDKHSASVDSWSDKY